MTALTPPDTLLVAGWHEDGKLMSVSFTAYFATRDEAKAFAARFPKSVRARDIGLSGAPGIKAFAEIKLDFSPNKVTGAKNDASIARYAAVLRAVKKLGIHLVGGPQIFSNQLTDLASIDHGVLARSKTITAHARVVRGHATKKSPAQLQREIDDALAPKKVAGFVRSTGRKPGYQIVSVPILKGPRGIGPSGLDSPRERNESVVFASRNEAEAYLPSVKRFAADFGRDALIKEIW